MKNRRKASPKKGRGRGRKKKPEAESVWCVEDYLFKSLSGWNKNPLISWGILMFHVLYFEAHINIMWRKNVHSWYTCISASNCIYFCFEWNGLLNACVLNKFFIYVLYSLLVYLTVYNLTTSAFLTWKQITFLIPKSTDKDTINCTV